MRPTVSILFPVHDVDDEQAQLTLQAFRAAARALCRVGGDVIVIDDGSPCTVALEQIIADRTVPHHVRRHKRRLGLVSALNTGARVARSAILTYCHTDCIVAEDSLLFVVDLFVRTPNIGMVLSALYLPDGSLQQLGGWIGQSARLCWSTTLVSQPIHWGDFWSVRRMLYPTATGLPEAYNPGYWECVDLAAHVRRSNAGVVTCPESRVTHFKSATFHAVIPVSERAAIFERNRTLFISRWPDLLPEFVAEVPSTIPDEAWR